MNEKFSDYNHNDNSGRLSPDEVQEMLPAYVLGALDAEEILAVDEYLYQQQSLLEQLNSLELTMAQLAHTAPVAIPPARVKSELMARVQAEAPVLATPPPVREPVQPLLPRTLERPRPKGWLDGLRGQPGSHWGWPVLAATAVAVSLLVIMYGLQASQEVNRLATDLETMQQEIVVLRTDNQRMEQANLDLRNLLLERENQLALLSNTTQVVTLEGTEAAPQARGTFYAGRTANVLILTGLQPLPPEQIYELWLIPQEGNPIPAGLVQVDETGAAIATLDAADPPQGFAAVGLSIEPAGGSPQPTGPIVLLGSAS
jgi:anti-sigma-K factor RskA